MVRVQLVMSDEDRARFVDQARREGMSLSAWLRVAARERLEAVRNGEQAASPEGLRSGKRFESEADLWEFFRKCEELDGPETEPDWSEHLRVINESRARGFSGT